MFKTFDNKVFSINESSVVLNNLYEITNDTVLYIISKINFPALEEVSIVNTSFPNSDLLLMLMDLIALDSKNLKAFVIEDVGHMLNAKVREKFSQKVKNILEASSDTMALLRLNKLGLETKDFCMLCLGIGSSRRL